MTIRLDVIDNKDQHFAVAFDRPGLIEVQVINGRVVAYVYNGSKPGKDQEPLTMYDGTIADEMESVRV